MFIRAGVFIRINMVGFAILTLAAALEFSGLTQFL